MDFELDEDQQLLVDSARKWLGREYGLARLREQIAGGARHFDRSLWRAFADLGWLGLSIEEACGGLGQPLSSALGLVEALGEHLVMQPYADCVLAPATLLSRLGSQAQKSKWLPLIAQGEALVACAHQERGRMWDAHGDLTTRVEAVDGGWLLHGEKVALPFGASVDRWIVTARLDSTSHRDGGGELTAWWVDASAPGLEVRPGQAVDGTPMADIRFHAVSLAPQDQLGQGPALAAALERAHAQLVAAVCVESLGVMSTLMAQTLDYVKTRRQFGGAIGGFQVVQHRMADIFVQLELARPLAWLAVSVAETPDRAQFQARAGLLCAAKVQVSESSRFVAEQALQLHGGIGMTEELMAAHLFKRLVRLERRLGGSHDHLGRLVAALQRSGGDALLQI